MSAEKVAGIVVLCTWAAIAVRHAQASTQSSPAPVSVTVQGCLQRSPAEPPSSAAASARTAVDLTSPPFILTDVATTPTRTTGSSAATPGPEVSPHTVVTYRLDADERKLSSHVGQQVQVTGNLDEQSATTTSPAVARVSSTSTTTVDPPRLKVQDVTMIASSCSAAK